MIDKVTWDRGAPYEDVVEAVRRVFVRDGIPRHVSADGTIKKYDWECPETVDVDEQLLEDYVKSLIDGQQG